MTVGLMTAMWKSLYLLQKARVDYGNKPRKKAIGFPGKCYARGQRASLFIPKESMGVSMTYLL